MNDEFLWNQEAENFASLQAYETKSHLTKNRKRFLLTMPEAIADQVKDYANNLRAEYDKQILAETRREAIAKWKQDNPLSDWIERRSIEFWSRR